MEVIVLSHPGGGTTWVLGIVGLFFVGFVLLVFVLRWIEKKLGRKAD